MATALTYYTELQSPTVNGDVDLWGNILNATSDAWDRALAGLATASLAAGNWTPSTTEGECLVLKPTGILVANRTIIVPAKKRRYIVWNICTGAFSVTIIVAGVGVECQQGVFTYVYCDGTDVYNVAGGGSSLTLTSSDAGAGAAPTLDFYRNSASPAASDLIGIITLTGEDSAGNTQTYATLTGKIIDPTSTSEDGELLISTVIAGTVAVRWHWGAGGYAEGVTGGDKGAGSINATTIYQANVALGTAAFGTLGTSGTTVPLLDGNNTFSGSSTFSGTVAFTGSTFTYSSTDAGAGAAPTVDLYRNSASPFAADLIGIFTLTGEDSAGNTQTYATIGGVIDDPTSTSEDGSIYFATAVAGTVANRLLIGAGIYSSGVTGGDKGAGTANFTTIYQANVALGTAAFVATGTSGATVPLLNTNVTWSGTQTITTAATNANLMTLSSTDAGAVTGAILSLYRDSASPVASDVMSSIIWYGRDSGATITPYFEIFSTILDPTDTSEDAKLSFRPLVAGAATTAFEIANGVIVGAPTGSFQGTGSINAAAVYANGVRMVPTVQVFAGTGTWTRPAGCIRVWVRGVGGGGGGGGADSSGAGAETAGGGGGGGEYFEEIIDVSATASAAVTIGAAGSAGSNAGGNGGLGGTTSFAAFCTGVGGTGGTGTGSAAVDNTEGAGGAGGTGGTAGDLNIPGQPGTAGWASDTSAKNRGGAGGSSQLGGGGTNPSHTASGTTAGEVGSGFGSGGGGARSVATAGAAGALGKIGHMIVHEYYA